jgi:hypothetical protein
VAFIHENYEKIVDGLDELPSSGRPDVEWQTEYDQIGEALCACSKEGFRFLKGFFPL